MEQIYLWDMTKKKLDLVGKSLHAASGEPVTYDEIVNFMYDQLIKDEDLRGMYEQHKEL